MVKFGRKITPQLKYHPSETFSNGEDHESDAETAAEDENDSKKKKVTPLLSPNLKDVAKKGRKTVTIFRRYLVKNDDNLHPFALEIHRKEKMLLLDCKINVKEILRVDKRDQNGVGAA